MTAIAIIITMIIATVFGVIAIRQTGTESANTQLLQLCETGQKNLDSYFNNVEQSVKMAQAYVEEDMTGIDDAHLQAHLNRASDIMQKLTFNNNGILTYYYRIDPSVSQNVKGFWYVYDNEKGFQAHEVTDISQYDTSDTSQLVWFTVPKATGKAVWLPPYITENLGARVLSYNTPIYYDGKFVGVIGIELDYKAMAEQIDNITLYENGYAFLTDEEGYLVYHPRVDVTDEKADLKMPDGVTDDNTIITYTYEGVRKKAAKLPLENGMYLYVTVPVSEINASWHKWIGQIIIAFAILLVIFLIQVRRWTDHITKPLQDLTEMARQVDEGNYDCQIAYDEDNEIGLLTKTFNNLTTHLKKYITDLNDLAYADALTSVHNKGAFDITVQNMQVDINEKDEGLKFAVCMFDCNDLKSVNDENGHDKGDIYLKETAQAICEVFAHSPVFRVGGDEFAVLLINKDYKDRDELLKRFDEVCAERRNEADVRWEKIDVARGMADYDPEIDESVSDVVRRADKLMYENKWHIKGMVRGEKD